MSDTLVTIIAIFLAAVLMFVFPLMSVAERNDDIAQLAVNSETADFVNKVRTSGTITSEDYYGFIQKINSTGNSFDVDIELKILDKNLSAKVGQANAQKIGENVYYSKYTTQLESELKNTGKCVLKDGDKICVTVKNTNKTIAQMLKNFFFGTTGSDTYQIVATESKMVSIQGK
ncbi:MAG: hypothetical protein IKP28_00315 [Clostridia bacterium]|nr:hypothetical protein [Clostridia bacterium]